MSPDLKNNQHLDSNQELLGEETGTRSLQPAPVVDCGKQARALPQDTQDQRKHKGNCMRCSTAVGGGLQVLMLYEGGSTGQVPLVVVLT